MRVMKVVLAGGLVLALSACATKPEPVIEEPVRQVAAPRPAPTLPPVVEEYTPPPVVDNLPAPGSIEDFAYQSGGEPRVFFGYDQFTLSPEARIALTAQANWMNNYQTMNAIIEGHADERGTREYNLALAARRAEAIKSYLVSLGVSPSRLTTVSYGKERPIDARSNEAGWARNRNGYTNLTTSRVS